MRWSEVAVNEASPSYAPDKTKSPVPEGYKQTELGIIPEDWEVYRLGTIGEALIGLTYRPSDVREHGTLVLRSSNIQNGSLAFYDNVYVEAEIPDKILVRVGDILICVRNGSRDLIGKSVYLDERVEGQTFGAFMTVYRSKIGKLASFYFQSPIIKRQVSEHLGATINQITNKSLNSFQISIPTDAEEQRAIATALSDVDALLEELDRLIAKKRDLKQATMQQLLTGQTRLPGFGGEWKRIQIGDIGRIYGGLTGKSKSDFGTGSGLFVPFTNVMENTQVDCQKLEKVRVTERETQNRVMKGDVLFNGSSETPEEVAMCALMTEDIPHLYLNSFCFGFRIDNRNDVNSLYFVYLIRSDEGRKLVQSLAQGSTRYNISKTALLEAEIALPDMEEQAAISQAIKDMETDILILEKRRNKTAALKQAMMQELLTGRTRLI